MDTSHAAEACRLATALDSGAVTEKTDRRRPWHCRLYSVCQVIVLLIAATNPPLQARDKPVEDAAWAIYRTPHFEIMTTQPPRSIGPLIEDIALFRAVVVGLLGEGAEELGSIRVRFLVLDHPGDVQFLFDSAPGVTGFTRPSLSGDLMVVGRPPARRMLALGNQVVFHEYVHQLVQMRSHSRHPAWYAEGIADFLSTLERRGDEVILGAVPDSRRITLGRELDMPLDQVLTATSTWSLPVGRRSGFYARAWLLVHHLLLADDREERDFARSLATYLDAYDRGEPSLEAFASAFSLPVGDLDIRLERHYRKLPTIRYPVTAFPFANDWKMETLSVRERTLLLARYTRESNPEEALRMLTNLQPVVAQDAEFLAALAVVHAYLRRDNEVESLLSRAIDLDEHRFAVWLEAGRAWRTLCSVSGEDCVPRGYLRKAGAAFDRAYALDPEDVEARTRHAQHLLRTEKRGEALPLLAASLAAAPWSFEVLHSMAIAYVARGRLDLARNYLEKALGWSVDHPGLQEDVSRLLREIEILEAPLDESVRPAGKGASGD
jgi:Flp pilus assembly protein TadD